MCVWNCTLPSPWPYKRDCPRWKIQWLTNRNSPKGYMAATCVKGALTRCTHSEYIIFASKISAHSGPKTAHCWAKDEEEDYDEVYCANNVWGTTEIHIYSANISIANELRSLRPPTIRPINMYLYIYIEGSVPHTARLGTVWSSACDKRNSFLKLER